METNWGRSEVHRLLRAATVAGLAPGFVACWGRPGKLNLVAAGMRGLGAGPTGPELWYDLASLTKPLVTATLTLLARRHGLALADPLVRHLPQLASTPWGKVTVAQCLTHTAGFPSWAPLYREGAGRESYLRVLGQVEPVGPAGQQVVYSCLGFIVLGFLLEQMGQMGLEALFAREVLQPLGLVDKLGFRPSKSRPVALGAAEPTVERTLCREQGLSCEPPPPLAGVWSCDDGNARGLGGVAGNAGLFGTAAGVAELASQYLPGHGQLLEEEEKRLATSLWTAGMEQARGLGWQLAATAGSSAGPALSTGAFGHTGFTGTSLWVDPELGCVFVLLANRLHPGGRTPDLHPLRRRFHALAVAGLRLATPPPSMAQ